MPEIDNNIDSESVSLDLVPPVELARLHCLRGVQWWQQVDESSADPLQLALLETNFAIVAMLRHLSDHLIGFPRVGDGSEDEKTN